ncbi:66fdcb73-29b2-4555-882d-417b842e1a50 [Thermothielavioides terrestris]|nr:66fdcb73-29b2-4555-882d-417b842e1a50 [Thermothielavioides terrestris]
MIVERL